MEENKDISQIALERIKESGMKPLSKNVINLKRVFFWALVGFAVLVGSVAFSITLSLLFNNDWYLYNKLGFSFIFKSLPYFWVVCLLVFTVLGKLYYQKTLLGYRHTTAAIVGVYVVLTFSFGLVLYLLGDGESVEQSLFENVPFYRIVIFDRNDLWSHPEQGLISGRVIEVNGSVIKIMDLNNVVRVVNIGNVPLNNQAKIRIGGRIKIMGDNDDIFSANQIH